jgi:hypothetical protein
MADIENDNRTAKSHPEKVRKRFRNSPHTESHTLRFLNSNFGLFLLTSVFLSVFSWGYHQWTAYLTKKQEDSKAYQQISLEIVNRLKYVEEMETPFQYDERRLIQESLFGFNPSANVNPSYIRHYSAMFPEYQQRSLPSLIWEIEKLSSPGRRSQLQVARQKAELVEGYLGRLEYSEISGTHKGPDKTIGIFALSDDDRSKFKNEVLEYLKFLEEPAYDLPN